MHYFIQHHLIDPSNNLFDKRELWIVLVGVIGTIVGVFVGFFLTILKEHRENKDLKNALTLELEGNLLALEQKKDIIQKIINALQEKAILPGHGVPLPTLIFDKHIASIIKLFNPIKRDLIQNIYGRLHLIDNFLDNFEDRLLGYLKNDNIKDPYVASISILDDLKTQCGTTQELIKSILENNPIDIYNRKNKKFEDEGLMKVPTPESVKEERSV